MKRKANKLIIGIIFLAGLSLLLYPFVANQWNNYRQKQLISSYEQTVSEKDAEHEIDYDAELQKAEAYNEALLPSILPDSFAVAAASDKKDQSYMDALNIAGDEMMGIVEIPKIDIKLPIYHTTDEDVLKQAAGHLEGSSLPIGGKSTHAVISAHRGRNFLSCSRRRKRSCNTSYLYSIRSQYRAASGPWSQSTLCGTGSCR